MRVLLTAASILAVLLAGITYHAQNGQDFLEAESGRFQLRQSQSEDIRDAKDCHFVINDVSFAGHRFLLDECTGDTWWFDQGWGYDSSDNYVQLRDPKWRRIARDE